MNEGKANGLSFLKEDSLSKLNSEEEPDAGDTVLCKSSLRETSFNFEGVRFSPKVIEFLDAFEGKQFTMKFKIQNIDKKPVLVRIGEPNSFIFQLKKPSRRVRLLASGSSLVKTITYSYHNDDLVQKSQIPIHINGHLVDYPIVVKKAVPEIVVEPSQLDFKQINLGASAKTMLLTIYNGGGKRTKFEIDLGKNDLDLVVNPMRGTLKAKTKITVVVEMMGMTEGEFFKELWVTTSEMSTRVPIIVDVVRPRLEIIHPNVTEDFVLIDFPPTFAKAQKAECFLLKNYSADTTLFITLAEIGGDLQFLKDARKNHDACKIFMFTAEEGRLEPFESRVLTALFSPKGVVLKKGWRSLENENPKKKESRLEHIIFVRMARVHCIEIKELAKVEARPTFNTVRERSDSIVQSGALLQPNFAGPSRSLRASHYMSELLDFTSGMTKSSGYLAASAREEKVLRVCLHGTAVEPDVSVQPTSFEFEPAAVGQTQTKVLRIKNDSVLPVKYIFRKIANVKVAPCLGWLQPYKAVELSVSITPTSGGKFEAGLQIDILGRSDRVFENDKALVLVAKLFVPFNYAANIESAKLVPKIGFGITPTMIDEVGLHKELATFKSDCWKPRAALLSSLTRTMRPEWMKRERDKIANVDNAIIAFPNDRPRNLYSWTKENICRTIFKGFFRYSPPADTEYTLTAEEVTLKKKNYLLWKDYLKALHSDVKCLSDTCSFENSPCFKSAEENLKLALKIPSTTVPLLKKLNKLLEKKTKHPKHNLVPLSPQHLNNVNVEPKLINFGTVAANNLVHETLNVYNRNPFPIGIRFVPGKTAVKVVKGDTIIISPFVTKSLAVSFESKDLGRHYGFLNYVINGSHQFKITISAYVTSKTLMLEDKNLVIEFGNYPAEYAFQPRSTFLELGNLLQSSICYKWQMPVDSAFVPDNLHGEVPPKTQLLTEIKFDMHPKKSFYSELNLVSESGSTELVKMIYQNRSGVSCFFLNNRIDVGDVSLNLPTKIVAIIQNASYHGVIFEVLNWNPIPGAIVYPRQGVLKPRSFLSLEISIKIPVVMKFSFDVNVMIHLSQKISVKVTGNVVMPSVKIKPTEIVTRKICANAFDVVTLCIENAGSTPAEVDIDLQECPEYKVMDERSHISLHPSALEKVKIYFRPKDVARYVFYLPIIVNKILGPPVMQEPQTEHLAFYISSFENLYEKHGKVYRSEYSRMKIPCVCINSTVSMSLLTISNPNVNFRPLNNADVKVLCQTVVLANDFTEEVTFCFRSDNLGEANGSPFDLIPVKHSTGVEKRKRAVKARLKLGEKLILNAIFAPKEPGTYAAEIPIYVRGYGSGSAYNYINLRGELKAPKLRVDSSELHFPPLPLNIGCDVVISILAENYGFADSISCLIWSPPKGGDTLSKYLTVTWLREPKINSLNEAQIFQALITFCSPVPVALRNYLVFADSSGNYCSVLVTAVSDNSMITTHAFLATRTSKFKLLKEVTSVKAENDSQVPTSKASPPDNQDDRPSKLGKKSNLSRERGFRKEISHRLEKTDIDRSSPLDNGHRLVVQATKSMTRITQLSFVNPSKNSFFNKNKECSSTVLTSTKSRTMNSVSQSDSYSTAQSADRLCREPESRTDVTHPDFPLFQDTLYGKHFQETLRFLERWMFEVVMRCDQYLEIPRSFQKLRTNIKEEKNGENQIFRFKTNENKNKEEKDFLDFLEEIVEPDARESFPRRLQFQENNATENLYYFYEEVLNYLRGKGCLFPYIKPEYLMNYDDYILFVSNHSTSEEFAWQCADREKSAHNTKASKKALSSDPKISQCDKMTSTSSSSIFARGTSWRRSFLEDIETEQSDEQAGEGDEECEKFGEADKLESRLNLVENRQFVHESEFLNKMTHEARSTQAWFDVIIQIFRTFILTKICDVPVIPEIEVIKPTESLAIECLDVKFSEQKQVFGRNFFASAESNLFALQERILLTWLNNNFDEQKDFFWKSVGFTEPPLASRPIANFDKDLADSLALILVTVAYCPYLVDLYFSDVFLDADTPSKACHNAGKLTLAWKTLNIGLTVESTDLINPNPVFMILLVVQLYKVLPTLRPRFQLNFLAPLSSDFSKTITIKNEYHEAFFYQVKFMGEHEGSYRLKSSTQAVVAKPLSTTEIHVIFTARRIKKVSAILILCGYVVSPNFAQHVCVWLEGEPSNLCECTKLSFSTPLYKVLCTEIPINPPYAEPTTYDIWYTTNKPVYKENYDISSNMKPWSKIWNRKVARRLFLNKSNITIVDGAKSAALGITVACMTEEERNFWLLFRSFSVGDFIILVNIKANTKMPIMVIDAFYPESSKCLCSDGGKAPNGSDFKNCPLLTEVSIPVRNEPLWSSVKSMFMRTLHRQEKSFWSKHFETNIGLCLILWFINVEEEENVANEFIHVLQTRVLYSLKIEPPNNRYLTVPEKIEILDVRKKSEITVPIHVSPNAPKKLKFILIMISEDEKELRKLKINLTKSFATSWTSRAPLLNES